MAGPEIAPKVEHQSHPEVLNKKEKEETMTDSNLARLEQLINAVNNNVNQLKGDVKETTENLRSELKAEIQETTENLRSELKAEIQETSEKLRSELKAEIQETSENLRSELKAEIQETSEKLRSELKAEIQETSEKVNDLDKKIIKVDATLTGLEKRLGDLVWVSRASFVAVCTGFFLVVLGGIAKFIFGE